MCVCGSTFFVGCTRTRNQYSPSFGSEQQLEGWRFVPDTILPGYQWAPQLSRQGHPRYTGARKGRPWVAHEIRQHSTQCRNTPNMVVELCRSRARVARRSTRTTTTNAEMLTISVCTCVERAERAWTVCSVNCPIPGDGYRQR